MRCSVQPDLDQRLSFCPTALSDQQIASGVLKRAAAGAAFVSCFDKLYRLTSCHIIWDVQVKQEPPATIRACKPKLHLAANVKLQKDFFYKLV